MKSFRTVLFWCHLTAGLTAALVVLIMSVTGVLLTYERQIVRWADTRDLAIAPPAPGAPHLAVETLLARVGGARPDATVQTLTVRREPTAPAAVVFGRDGMLYVDPYTGALVGAGSPGTRDFFRTVTNWHRWLAVGSEHRAAARAVTGASNLVFLFMVCSGVYLWFPRTWTWLQFKSIVWFRGRLPGKARDFNWHNVTGFWSAVPLVVVVSSAVVMSYPWASNLVYRAAGEAPPALGRGPGAGSAAGPATNPTAGRAAGRDATRMERSDGGPERSGQASLDGLDALWSRAERHVSGWRSISLRLPASPEVPLVFTIDQGDGGQPQKRGQLTLDRRTGEVLRWEPFSASTPGRRLRTILRFAHTGEVLGLAGQTVAGLASAGGSVLVYTGLALSCRRFLAWKRRGSLSAPVTPCSRPVETTIDAASAAALRVEALD